MERRRMTARVVPQGSAEASDSRMGGSVADRVAAVTLLTLEAWRLSGRPFPVYTRATMPVVRATLADHQDSV